VGDRANISTKSAPKEVADAVEHVISELNKGRLRVATAPGVGQWTGAPMDQEGRAAVVPPA
jgi:2,3,4,5-tetrahydropyridine-2-carboxylate N-succinyltransferase